MAWLRLRGVLMALAVVAGPASPPADAGLNPAVGVGNWIWDHEMRDRQECRFVRPFELPDDAEVAWALLRITADNSYEVFLDGQPIGRGGDWRVLIEYDLRLLLRPGRHVLAVRAVNDFDVAGLLVGLRIKLADDTLVEIGSDESWTVVPPGVEPWTGISQPPASWRPAMVRELFDPKARPQIYHAPVSQPVVVTLWERRWFQLSLLAVAGAGVAAGLFLSSRLWLKTQAERIVRRERARIAVDLHDNLGGGLTRLVLLGETSRRELPGDSATAATLDRLSEESRDLMRGMNETVWLINSQRDTVHDFASYVVRYAESFFAHSPVRCRFDLEEDLPPLPCDLGIPRNLFLAVKEALNNVLRHSGAHEVEVGIHRERHELVVTIRDDGRGFDPAASPDGGGGGGNGLRNMRLRAAEAGGRFTLQSVAGRGTTIAFHVPVRTSSRAAFAQRLAGRWRRGRARQ